MPSKRTLHRLSVIAIGIVTIALFSAAPAEAAKVDPPFEIEFPQEVTVTEFSSTFGAGRSGGRRHKGNDLMAPKMTEVYAIADGIVERVASSGNAGRYITLAHADGWTSTYMHLNNDVPGTDNGRADWNLTLAPSVTQDAAVYAGQLIGYVGDSGNAEWTGPHTHFELRHNGKAVNPYSVLVDAAEREYALYAWNVWKVSALPMLDLME